MPKISSPVGSQSTSSEPKNGKLLSDKLAAEMATRIAAKLKGVNAPALGETGNPTEGSHSSKPVLELEAGSKRLGDLATRLSRKLSAFEDWLNLLPGKVEATLWIQDSDDDTGLFYYGLRFHRIGKRWILDLTLCHCDDPSPEYRPVAESTVEEKLLVLGKASELLEAISNAQVKLEKRLANALSDFDEFAASVGLSIQSEGE